MKLKLGVFVILLGVALAAESGEPQSDGGEDIVHQFYVECAKSYGVEQESLKKLEEEDLESPETDERKVLAECLFEGLGFNDDDGKIDADVVQTALETFVSEGRAKEIAQKCNVQKENTEGTAFRMGRCLYQELHNSKA